MSFFFFSTHLSSSIQVAKSRYDVWALKRVFHKRALLECFIKECTSSHFLLQSFILGFILSNLFNFLNLFIHIFIFLKNKSYFHHPSFQYLKGVQEHLIDQLIKGPFDPIDRFSCQLVRCQATYSRRYEVCKNSLMKPIFHWLPCMYNPSSAQDS